MNIAKPKTIVTLLIIAIFYGVNMKIAVIALAAAILPTTLSSQDYKDFAESLTGFTCKTDGELLTHFVFGTVDGETTLISPDAGNPDLKIISLRKGYRFDIKETPSSFLTETDGKWMYHTSTEDGPFQAICEPLKNLPRDLALAVGDLMSGDAVLGDSHEEESAASCSDNTPGSINTSFDLLDSEGNLVTDTDVFTKPALVYFGYTNCFDVCPIDLKRNAEVTEALKSKIRPVFITVDYKRDTPEVVGEFTDQVHPEMIGLTGSQLQIEGAAKSFRMYYKVHPEIDGQYMIDHSTFSYLVMPDLGVVDYFRRDDSVSYMTDTISCFINAAEPTD